MAYLAPIHRPTSVRHALKLNLFGPDEDCLVLATCLYVSPEAEDQGRADIASDGLLIVAETSISYLDEVEGEILSQPLEEATQFVAWTQIDTQRWLLADDFGKLYLLMLLLDDDNEVTSWRLDVIGKTARASVLVYLDEGYMFVGSHQGDSQYVKIQEQGVELVQTISNIAPILDFTIMDMGNRSGEGQTNEYSSGQARIVTGSGAFQDGSLRSVRSGVGLEEQGILGEMSHATDLFSLHSSYSRDKVDVLVATFVGETRIFQFQSDGGVEETAEFMSFSLSESTLLATDLPNGRLLQVTGASARLIDSENGMVLSEWSPHTGITLTAASANLDNLALSVAGLEVVILDLKRDLKVKARRHFAEEGQIACVHVPFSSPDLCIAGFWQSGSVAILKVDTLETVQKVLVSDDAVSVPRSILLAQILPDQSPTLFIAMANGEVITFFLDVTKFMLSSKKVIVLGTEQASFKALPRSDGLSNVFATCEHPSLIYGSEGRIVYSAVTAEKASCICSFDSAAYPGAIAIATPEDVRIALVDTERTTHVQTLSIGETVRRIAYSTKLKAFGIGTIHRSLRQSQEIVQSRFKLTDEVMFKELDTYELNEEELVESVVRADLREGSDDLVERFVVGTAYLDDEHENSIRGRIIVFAVTTERTLKVITELPVKGACRALGVIDGKIVAALVKTVVIYSLHNYHLEKCASYRTSTAPIDITIYGNQIAIADLMKSVSVTTYTPGKNGLDDTLVETGRHFQTAWGTAVARVGEDTWLEADAEGNLMVLKQNVAGVTVDDRRRLEVESEIRLGEMVNRIRSFDVEVDTKNPSAVVPKSLMGTVEGSIYLFGLIAPSHRDLLMRLQTALAPLVQSLGDVPFNAYRAFKNQVREAEEPFRFVDGELVEAFLDLSGQAQEGIVEELGEVGKAGGGVEGIREMVEGLKRLH
ncbi:DNA damage-binding protein 1, partial [Lecanoromycetidae sp. Uapishka_2]